jgi:hypothetical protein
MSSKYAKNIPEVVMGKTNRRDHRSEWKQCLLKGHTEFDANFIVMLQNFIQLTGHFPYYNTFFFGWPFTLFLSKANKLLNFSNIEGKQF